MKYGGQQGCHFHRSEVLLEETTERLQLSMKFALWNVKQHLMTALHGSGSEGLSLGALILKANPGWDVHQPSVIMPCIIMLKTARQVVEDNPKLGHPSTTDNEAL